MSSFVGSGAKIEKEAEKAEKAEVPEVAVVGGKAKVKAETLEEFLSW